MAMRHTTRRLSAGAALVTGLGMVGIAAAGPANADVTGSLEYTCEVSDLGITFDDPWKVDLTVGVEDSYEKGATIDAPDITAEVTPGADAEQKMRDLNIKTLEGSAEAGYSFGEETRTADLTVDKVDVPAEGTVTTVATGTGEEEQAPDEDTSVPITAGDFTAKLTTDTNFVLNLACTAPEDNAVGDVTIGEGSGEAAPGQTPGTDEGGTDEGETGEGETGEGETPAVEVNDWFTEPDSLPITEDQKSFTVEGTASQAGVLEVALLDSEKNVLRTDEWSVEEGENSKDFAFEEGTDYVRIISQECVDKNGKTEETLASGCNVEYYAPWINPDGGEGSGGESKDMGTDDAAVADDAATDEAPAESDQAGAPEVPTVVQTDGLQPQGAQQDNTLAIAVGGLLLAGAGAGTVLVARRRAATHR